MSAESGSTDITVVWDEEGCPAIYLLVDPLKIVYLQALFEAYEGVATVRTEKKEQSVVSILTTREMLPLCREVLESLHEEIGWQSLPSI